MTSRELFESQKARDRKHHEDRIAWLSDPEARWACGARMEPGLKHNMLQSSIECLADPTGMRGYNTGPQQ